MMRYLSKLLIDIAFIGCACALVRHYQSMKGYDLHLITRKYIPTLALSNAF